MTDRNFLKKMYAINHVLLELCKSKPFDQQGFDDCLLDMHHINQVWYLSRRRRPWPMILFILFLLFCLAWIVFFILYTP